MTLFLKSTLAALAIVAATGVAQAQSLEFTLDNQSSHNINYIYLSTPDAAEYGDDILGDTAVVPAGVSGTVTITDAGDQCEFDIQFVLDTKQVIEELGVTLCGGVTYTISDNQ